MESQIIQQCANQASWVDVATALAATAAVVAAASAFLSYRLSKGIYDEIKSDEIMIAGPLHHPGLIHPDHNDCVLRCTLFNKSKRKSFLKSVQAFDRNGGVIPITWSDGIDNVGNVQRPTGLLGVEGSVDLLIRRND